MVGDDAESSPSQKSTLFALSSHGSLYMVLINLYKPGEGLYARTDLWPPEITFWTSHMAKERVISKDDSICVKFLRLHSTSYLILPPLNW